MAMTDDEKMQHVVDHHGLETRPCPRRCSVSLPKGGTCKACNGHGVVFTMDTRRCGLACPVGNPQ